MSAARAPRLALVVALVAGLLAAARPARAVVLITDYQLALRARGDDRVEVEMRLAYRAVGEVKTDGFKFVGRDEPTELSASAPDGTALPVASTLEVSSGQHRIFFGLPAPDEQGVQTVLVRFVQHRTPSFGRGVRYYELEWAGAFRVPVNRMRVVATLPEEASPPGYTCDPPAQGYHVCERVTGSPAPVTLPLAPDESFPAPPLLAAALAVLALLVVVALVSRYRRLVRERGVLPPAPGLGYEAVPPTGAYRPPPELPAPASVTPTLSAADRRTFWVRAVVSLVVLVGSVLLLVATVPSPAPMPIPLLLLLGAGLASVAVLLFNNAEKPLYGLLLFVLVLAGAAALGFIAWIVLSAVTAVIAGIASAIQIAPPAMPGAGGGWSTGSSSSCSSSSSSSCGGGGGSSCGGGGGSSCGGGGGGGGCGG